jgi:hypothetical protein
MKPTRIGDNAFRGLLTIFSRNTVHPLAPDTYGEILQLLSEESRARGFKDWFDAQENFRWSEETSNDATSFDKLVKERAIAIKGLRKINALSMNGTTEQSSLNGHLAVNTAHNALDEIGDDRESELE